MPIQTVLMIDDESDIRTIGELSLASIGGWTVHLADRGAKGIALAAQQQPDVILLDVMMPELDGPSTLQRLKEDPAVASIPVIFLTAKVQKAEIQRYLELGAIGVIEKPFDPMSLPREIVAIVNGA